jgi:thioester reductase-like protein
VVTTALITGATGFLGSEILASLLARDPDLRLVALVRARSGVSLARRRQRLVANLPPAHAARVAAVHGDLTRPALGLSPIEYEALVAHVDRVIHVAATTSFSHSLAEARRQNVGGTAEALALCRRLAAEGKSGRLDYVSTAYVAGDRTDLVGEDELDVGQGFRNTYEQSKFEAEAL